MRFDSSVTREIHARVDIAALVGQYVPLRKRGKDLVGLCPFHAEKTPSFHVHADRGFFKCFGCGTGGDVITFVEKLENIPFPEAVRMLAARAGIEVQNEDGQSQRRRSEREAIYDANRIATAFFERMLASEAGTRARTYCEHRNFTPSTIGRFHIGYAPDDWSALTAELTREGVDLALAAKAGLVKTRQSGGYYDFYRDRLMVPTYATTGEVIAFGGRAIGEGEPKYLNTSTTPVYTKGRYLFALNVAKRATQDNRTAIVVEGYLDCIALHQAGFENAVAALGTSFTQEQATELHKYADNVFLCFDGDTAGENAATKAIDVATTAIEHVGSSVRIVILPKGEDPDSFVRNRGAAEFSKLLQDAKPSIEFKLDPQIDTLKSGFASPSLVARRAESLIQQMTPRAEWDKWRVYVAGRLKVNIDDLRNSRFLANAGNFGPRQTAGSRHMSVAAAPMSFEREALAIMLEDPTLIEEYRDRIPPDRFRNDRYREIYGHLREHAAALHATVDVFALFADNPESAGVLAALGQGDRSSTVRYADSDARKAHLERVVERLQLEDEKKRYQELSHQIDELVMAGRPVEAGLRLEYDALVVRLKK